MRKIRGKVTDEKRPVTQCECRYRIGKLERENKREKNREKILRERDSVVERRRDSERNRLGVPL